MRIIPCAILVLGCFSSIAGIANDVASIEQAAGTQVVGRYGDLSTLEIAGNEIFTSDEIRQALARDRKVQEACRPSAPLDDLVARLEQRLVEGYRYSGCPDAEVRISVGKEEQLVVRVVEGTRYTAGEVRVQGTSQVDETSLATSLTGSVEKTWSLPNVTLRQGGEVVGPVESAKEKHEAKQEEKSAKHEYDKTYWTSGKPVRFGNVSTDDMRPRVAEALLRQGYPEATFRLAIEPREGTGFADLVIHIDDLGPPSIVEEVTIEGLERHSPAQLLELMQLAEGKEFDIEQLQGAIERVQDSCRFWGCKITVDFPTPLADRAAETTGNARATRLLIDVVEYPHVAPLGELLSETDEILRRAALWCQQFHEQQEWELYGKLAAPAGEAYSNSKAEFWLSPTEGLMLDLRLKGSPPNSTLKLDGEYRVILGSAGLVFADIGHGDWVSTRLQAIGIPRLQLKEGDVEEGDFKTLLNLGFGVSSDPKPTQQLVSARPIALIDLAHNEGTRYEVKEGVLWIREKDWLVASFDASSGRLIHLEVGQGAQQGVLVATVPLDNKGWRAREAEIASYISRWDSDRPLASLIDYALDIASRISKDKPLVADSKRVSLRQLVDSKPFAALEWFITNKFIDNEPAIPDSAFQLPDSWKSHQDPKYSLAGLPDYLFVRETWPWTLSREAACLFGKQSPESRGLRQLELDRVRGRSDTGPICHWVLGKVGQTDRYAARHALGQLEDGTLDREIEMLTTPGTGLWETLGWLVPLAHSTTDEELDKLLSTITDAFDEPVIQAAQLLRRLDATSDETLRDSLGTMLRADLRPLVEADLRKLAAGRGKADRPALDFNKVGEPFPSASTEEESPQPDKESAKAEQPKILSDVLPFGDEEKKD